jgi:hypothetical protein
MSIAEVYNAWSRHGVILNQAKGQDYPYLSLFCWQSYEFCSVHSERAVRHWLTRDASCDVTTEDIRVSVHLACGFVTSPPPMELGKPRTADRRHGVIAKIRSGSWTCKSRMTTCFMNFQRQELVFESANSLSFLCTFSDMIWFLNLQGDWLVFELSDTTWAFNLQITICFTTNFRSHEPVFEFAKSKSGWYGFWNFKVTI